MEKGKVIAQGDFDQLSASSKVFQEMTKVSR
jgi:ABC-type transport system involved in cytochrome bd biosynthesis fused ATPase/permease subunit